MTELDTITREIKDLQKDMVANAWKIGARLNTIRDNKLYLDKYHFFDEYLAKETGFSITTAYRYMKIAKVIDFPRVGTYALSLRRWEALLPLPDEKRERILSQVEAVNNKKGHVSDKEFEKILKKEKVDIDIENKDFKIFLEQESDFDQELALIEELAELHKVNEASFDRVKQMKSFQDYKRKQKLIEKYHQIIKKVNGIA